MTPAVRFGAIDSRGDRHGRPQCADGQPGDPRETTEAGGPGALRTRRPRLLEFVDEVTRAPLTVVVAPVGAGKTSLLAGWIAERTEPCAWLSLDRSDRDPVLFWVGVISALENFRAGCGSRARKQLLEGGFVVDAVAQLLDDLEPDGPDAAPPAECTLVLDDLHCVDESVAATQALSLFVLHLPAWLHVVLVSRRSPNLPLDRFARRTARRGAVRRASLLAARSDRDAESPAPSLSEEQVRATVERADGLAVGLQMAALNVRAARVHEDGFAPAPPPTASSTAS